MRRSHRSSTRPRVRSSASRTRRDERERFNFEKTDRVVDAMERELEHIKSALRKFAAGGERFRPQLENAAESAAKIGSLSRVLYRLTSGKAD